MGFNGIYPLVNIQKNCGTSPLFVSKSTTNGPFSIAIWNHMKIYRMVNSGRKLTSGLLDSKWFKWTAFKTRNVIPKKTGWLISPINLNSFAGNSFPADQKISTSWCPDEVAITYISTIYLPYHHFSWFNQQISVWISRKNMLFWMLQHLSQANDTNSGNCGLRGWAQRSAERSWLANLNQSSNVFRLLNNSSKSYSSHVVLLMQVGC